MNDTSSDEILLLKQRLAEQEALNRALLEKLAEHVATLLLEEFAAQWVRVSVAKLGMMPGVKRVGGLLGEVTKASARTVAASGSTNCRSRSTLSRPNC